MVAFFILSGFSMAINYGKKDLTEWSEYRPYLIKRIISIYPVYIAVYLLYIIFQNDLSFKNNIIIAPIELSMTQSWFSTLFSYTHNGGTWFLSCIFVCYIIYPLGAKLFAQMSLKERVLLMSGMYLLCSYAPVIPHRFSENVQVIYSNVLFRTVEFVIGIAMAFFQNDLRIYIFFKKISKFSYLVVESILFVAAITIAGRLRLNYLYESFVAIPFFAFVILQVSLMENKQFGIFNSSLTTYLSNISYCFFLAQFFVWDMVKKVREVIPLSNYISLLVAFGVCAAISVLLYELVQKPIKSLMVQKL